MKNIYEIYKESEYLQGIEVTRDTIILEQFLLFESFIRSTYKIADSIVNEKNANCIMKIFINSTKELQAFNQEELKIIFTIVKKVVNDNEKLEVFFEEITDKKSCRLSSKIDHFLQINLTI
jgi:dihydroorotase